MATITAPVYGKAWTHPSTGEVRYYINNVWDIATARRGKAWMTNGELHVSEDMHYTTEAKIRAAVEAHPMQAVTPAAKGELKTLLEADFGHTMTRMMDEGWQ